MRVVEVTRAQKKGAALLIKMQEEDGDPVRPWTRRVAAARPRPTTVDPELEDSDEVVVYLV